MKIMTFGEIMLRLRPEGKYRFFQTDRMEAVFGGSEANVAVALANYGMDAAFFTVLPQNFLGDACLGELRSFGVDVSRVQRGPGRMGIYFLENGVNQLSGKVTYDREYSAVSVAEPGSVDWDAVLSGCGWLHLSGITPAVSDTARQLTVAAAAAARARGIRVSLDLNYRKNLWNYGKSAREVLKELTGLADYLVAGDDQLRQILGVECAGDFDAFVPDARDFEALCHAVTDAFPGLSGVAVPLRRTHSADWNDVGGYYWDRERFCVGPRYEIRNIVDRLGGGDSFTAGLIFGLNTYGDPQKALEFAVASCCLKHSVPGDFNRVSRGDVENLMNSREVGRVQR